MRLPRILFTTVLLLMLGGLVQADPGTDAVRKVAEGNAAAIQKGDYEAIIKATYPKLVEVMGGKDKMIEIIKEGLEGMKSRGMKITSITIAEPGKIATAGDKMYSIVPMTMVITAPDAKITQNSFLLAVSTDKGTSWALLDGSDINSESIKTVIPDFPDDFKLPEKEDPSIEPIAAKTP